VDLQVLSLRKRLRGGAFRGLYRLPKGLTRRALHQTILISNSKKGLRALDLAGVQSRNDFTLEQIAEAVADITSLPHFAPIVLWTGDRPLEELGETHLAYSTLQSGSSDCIAIPDFVFTGWPEAGIESFHSMANEIRTSSASRPAVRKVGWRGSIRTSPLRAEVDRIASSHPELFDLQHVDVASPNLQRDFLTMSEQAAQFAALLDIEGVGYLGRWKLQLMGYRPVLWVDRPYVEFWFESLPDVYSNLRVDRSLDGLASMADFALHAPEASATQREVEKFARLHFTKTLVSSRWLAVLRELPMTERPFAHVCWQVFSKALR
jgi:hypothetical protein